MDIKNAKIRELNDLLRTRYIGGQVVFSAEVSALHPEQRAKIVQKVVKFKNFTAENDPYKEHDFGKISLAGEDYFWKIDYYDLDFCFHSPDAADPTVTKRVLTIMRADEW